MDANPPFDGADDHPIDASGTNIEAHSATDSNTTDIQHDDTLVAASSTAIDALDVTINNTSTTQLDSAIGSNTTDGRNTASTQNTSHQIDATNCLTGVSSPPLNTAGIQRTSHQINTVNPSVYGTPVNNNELVNLNISVSKKYVHLVLISLKRYFQNCKMTHKMYVHTSFTYPS
jgi:hypothetical protein